MIQILIFLFLVFTSSKTEAAITCTDANSVGSWKSVPSDPETIAYTTPSGTNQILFVGVGQRVGAALRTHTNTHAGNALSIVTGTSEQYTDPAGAGLYYILNPTSGTNNVVIDWNVAPLADGIIIWTCSGVNTADPFRSVNNATGTGTTFGSTPASVQSGDMVVDFVFKDGSEAITLGANQTSIQNSTDGAESAAAASWQDGANGAVMDETTSASQQWGHISVVLKPAPSSNHGAPIIMQ